MYNRRKSIQNRWSESQPTFSKQDATPRTWNRTVQSCPNSRTEETTTARDVTGFCALFSTWKPGNFLHIWGHLLTKLHRSQEKQEENSKKNNQWSGAPKLQTSVPCRGRTRPDNSRLRTTESVPLSAELLAHSIFLFDDPVFPLSALLAMEHKGYPQKSLVCKRPSLFVVPQQVPTEKQSSEGVQTPKLPQGKYISGPKKTVTATDVTGFYAFFSARKWGNFLHVFGPFPCWITQQTWRKGKTSSGESSKKSSGDGAPTLQISVPCRGRTCPEYSITDGWDILSFCLPWVWAVYFRRAKHWIKQCTLHDWSHETMKQVGARTTCKILEIMVEDGTSIEHDQPILLIDE